MQWTPPPPRVNMETSGSKTSNPCALRRAFRSLLSVVGIVRFIAGQGRNGGADDPNLLSTEVYRSSMGKSDGTLRIGLEWSR